MRWTAMVLAAVLTIAPVAAQPDADEFEHSYPPAARAIPALNARFDREAATLRTRFLADARQHKVEAARDKRTHHGWHMVRSWSVVADTPRFLSLSLETYQFSGGAHGTNGFGALVWDRKAGRAITPLSFFTSPAALNAAMRRPFCDALDRQRAAKREQPVRRGVGLFDDCVDPTKSTLILGSANRRTFDRVGVLLGSYEGGPYVDGTYDVTVPITTAVLAAVTQWSGSQRLGMATTAGFMALGAVLLLGVREGRTGRG